MLNEQTVPLNVTIRISQRERLVAYAKHSGALSISEAMRDLLDRVLPLLPADYSQQADSFPAEEVGK
jgi:hypothetical protein